MCPQAEENYNAIKVLKSDELAQQLEKRHIFDEELKIVILHGETTGEKLYQTGSDRFLTKKQLYDGVYYVEYSPSDSGYKIHTAYRHRSEIIGGG